MVKTMSLAETNHMSRGKLARPAAGAAFCQHSAQKELKNGASEQPRRKIKPRATPFKSEF
jgi:hypothetical protein